MNVRPVDERPHAPTDDPTWVEAWLFDVVQPDTSVAVSIELLLWPQHGRVAFHTSVVRPAELLVSLVELEAPAPKPPSLEVRSSGLWTEIGIQTPLDHMTVDMEAFAVALDDPAEVFEGGYGIRTPLGSELEWETAGEIRPGSAATSYELPCVVHGELLLGDEVIEIDGWGWRSHRWGSPLPGDRTGFRGRSADGQWLIGQTLDPGSLTPLGVAPVPAPSLDARLRQAFVHNDTGDIGWARTVH